MIKYYSKEDREKVEKLNFVLNMRHRSKPYDLNNVDDVKEALKLIVAEFIDYQNYHFSISEIFSDFDESLEYYDPLTWMAKTEKEITGDPLVLKANAALAKADDLLCELSARAKKKCRSLLIIILKQNSDFKREVLGKPYLFSKKGIDDVFADCIKIRTYTMEDSLEKFIKIIDKHLNINE